MSVTIKQMLSGMLHTLPEYFNLLTIYFSRNSIRRSYSSCKCQGRRSYKGFFPLEYNLIPFYLFFMCRLWNIVSITLRLQKLLCQNTINIGQTILLNGIRILCKLIWRCFLTLYW